MTDTLRSRLGTSKCELILVLTIRLQWIIETCTYKTIFFRTLLIETIDQFSSGMAQTMLSATFWIKHCPNNSLLLTILYWYQIFPLLFQTFWNLTCQRGSPTKFRFLGQFLYSSPLVSTYLKINLVKKTDTEIFLAGISHWHLHFSLNVSKLTH